MKSSNLLLNLAATLALAGLVSCGAPEGEIEISTSGGDTTGDVDTVVRREVVVDTVVQPSVDTVVHIHKDTLVGGGAPGTSPAPIVVTASERRLIDLWLAARRDTINEYGDPVGTMYTGGTPLFDETTGQPIDRYEYIMRKHPDRPWRSTR